MESQPCQLISYNRELTLWLFFAVYIRNSNEWSDSQLQPPLFHNFLKAILSSLPGVPALLAPTEKLCIGAAPKDRLRARPEPEEEDWRYWKLAEVFSGEEGTLRDGRGSVMRSVMDWKVLRNFVLQPWRMDLLSSDGVWGWEKHRPGPGPGSWTVTANKNVLIRQLN